ncbi:MAG: copper amine oxidase N-terminal domain-containing protein [Clostridiales bacterium]|nr:copper amine oxidase N-terminal domain-containing protein [Clostridiales bacterium]
MKKMLSILTICLSVISSANFAFGAVNISRSSEISINSDSRYTSENIYSYSSGDKSSDQTVVFQVGSLTAETSDGTIITIEQAPYISQGRTMLPLRAVAETLRLFENSVSVSWNSADKQAVVSYGDNEVIFTADSNVYTVNGNSVTMEGGKPEIKNGRVFIPLRELANAMELNIEWDSSTKKITIMK